MRAVPAGQTKDGKIPMQSTAMVTMVLAVIGYLLIERIFVIPKNFLPIYIGISALLVMLIS